MEKRTVDVVVISDVQLRDMWSHSPTSEKNNRNRKGLHFDNYDTDICSPVIKKDILEAEPRDKGHITIFPPIVKSNWKIASKITWILNSKSFLMNVNSGVGRATFIGSL